MTKSGAHPTKINPKFAYVLPMSHTMVTVSFVSAPFELNNFRVLTDFFDQKDEHVECTVR